MARRRKGRASSEATRETFPARSFLATSDPLRSLFTFTTQHQPDPLLDGVEESTADNRPRTVERGALRSSAAQEQFRPKGKTVFGETFQVNRALQLARVCANRQSRKEIIFATKNHGAGNAKPTYNNKSKVSCK